MYNIRFIPTNLFIPVFLFTLAIPLVRHLEEPHAAGDSLSGFPATFKEDQNTVYSPYGMETLAAMMAIGAKTETLVELQNAFQFPACADDIIALHHRIQPDFPGKTGSPLSFLAANSLWVAGGITLNPVFQEHVSNGFDADVVLHDFSIGSETNRHDINAWVQRQTADKISFITDGFAPETRMVVVNAIDFCCNWCTAFDPANTKNRNFILANGEKIPVPMMQQQMRIPYFEDEEVTCILLPYTQKNLGMILVLPKNTIDENTPIHNFSLVKVTRWQKQMVLETVDCLIPKFRMESSFDLKPVFGQLGVTRAFDQDKADFSGITVGGNNLFISKAVQKITLEIGETGTEAAAATAAIFVPKSPMNMINKVMHFHANRPFYFAVMDIDKGTFLFVGRYVAPVPSE